MGKSAARLSIRLRNAKSKGGGAGEGAPRNQCCMCCIRDSSKNEFIILYIAYLPKKGAQRIRNERDTKVSVANQFHARKYHEKSQTNYKYPNWVEYLCNCQLTD